MTADEFKRWRRGMRYTQAEAANMLGVPLKSIGAYEKGEWPNFCRADVPDKVAILAESLANKRGLVF